MKEKLIIGVLVGIIGVLLLAYIFVASDISLAGLTLGETENSLRQAKKENLELRQQLDQLESYTNISTKAASMGFVFGDPILYSK